MGIKDNFTQAMKELTNPRPSDARKEVRDVASYMNDTADAQPTEPVQAVQNTQPSENEQPEQQIMKRCFLPFFQQRSLPGKHAGQKAEYTGQQIGTGDSQKLIASHGNAPAYQMISQVGG